MWLFVLFRRNTLIVQWHTMLAVGLHINYESVHGETCSVGGGRCWQTVQTMQFPL